MNFEEMLDAIRGKTVAALMISENESELAFVFDDGSRAHWSAYGDCCSESWFADLVGVEDLVGFPIVAGEAVDMRTTGAEGRTGMRSTGTSCSLREVGATSSCATRRMDTTEARWSSRSPRRQAVSKACDRQRRLGESRSPR